MKLKKGVVMLAAAFCVAMFASAAMAVDVANVSELQNAINGSAKDIRLTGQIELTDVLTISRDITLDLNGQTLKRTHTEANGYAVVVQNGAKLIINDGSSGKTGVIRSENTAGNESSSNSDRGIKIGGDSKGGSVVMNGGTIMVNEEFGVGIALYASQVPNTTAIPVNLTVRDGAVINGGHGAIAAFGNKSTVNIEGGVITARAYAISGNGTNTADKNNGGSEINISGGTITSKEDVAIYHPQAGVLNISGGTISGHDGIEMPSGTLNMSGGIVMANGEALTDFDKVDNGSILTGAALAIMSRGGASDSYAGNVIVNITGGTLESENGQAILEAESSTATTVKLTSLVIEDGTFIGAEGKDVISMTNATHDNTKITGGAFSSDPNTCPGMENANIAEGTMVDGKYVIGQPQTPQSSGSGGGCSVGFGALALLAAIPLLRMRKK